MRFAPACHVLAGAPHYVRRARVGFEATTGAAAAESASVGLIETYFVGWLGTVAVSMIEMSGTALAAASLAVE